MRKTERHRKFVSYAVMGIGSICIGILLIPTGILIILIYCIYKIIDWVIHWSDKYENPRFGRKRGVILKRILLVDDDKTFRYALSELLSKEFEVLKSFGVKDALKKLETASVDLICSDYNMRDGTGLICCILAGKGIFLFHLCLCQLMTAIISQTKLSCMV